MAQRSIIEDDRVWGSVLIALGIASIAFRPFERFDRWVHGSTDFYLTISLIILAAVAVGIAVYARPSLKALAIVWIVTP